MAAAAVAKNTAHFVLNCIRLLERRIEVDIHAPLLVAVADIHGDREFRRRQHDQAAAITGVKPVPAEVARLGRNLSSVREKCPVERAPNAIPVLESEAECALV